MRRRQAVVVVMGVNGVLEGCGIRGTALSGSAAVHLDRRCRFRGVGRALSIDGAKTLPHAYLPVAERLTPVVAS
ncbi:MAG: hypothetical protein ABFR95_11140 [Actinomycetota bacterium]